MTTHHDETNSEAATSSPGGDPLDVSDQNGLALGAGAGGLWGNAESHPPGEAGLLRTMGGHKRRWTVNERA